MLRKRPSHLNVYYTYSGLAAFYRYWNRNWGDHFYTVHANEIGTKERGRRGNYGFVSEGTECLIYTRQMTGTVPLYRYMNDARGDHFYTADPHEIGVPAFGVTINGYRFEGIAGYCFPNTTYTQGTIPLYRYWKQSSGVTDHFYTTDSSEIGTTRPGRPGRNGYRSEGVACRVIVYYE